MHEIATQYDPYVELLKQAVEETRDREHESVTSTWSYNEDEGYPPGTYVNALAPTDLQYPFWYFDDPRSLGSDPEQRCPTKAKNPSKPDIREDLEHLHQEVQQEPTEISASESDAEARLQHCPSELTHRASHSSLGAFELEADSRYQGYPRETTQMESELWSSERPESISPLWLEDPSEYLQASGRVPELEAPCDAELIGGSSIKSSKRPSNSAQSSWKRRRLDDGRSSCLSSEPEMRGEDLGSMSTVAAKVPGGLARAYGQLTRRRPKPITQSRKTRAHTTLNTGLWPFHPPNYPCEKDINNSRHAEDSLYGLIGENNHNFPLGEHSRNDLFEEYNMNESTEKDCPNRPPGVQSLLDLFAEDNRSHSLLWDFRDRPPGRDILYDATGEDTSQFYQQKSEASHHLEDSVYESKAPTTSRLRFPDAFPEEKSETVLTNQKYQLSKHQPPTSTSLARNSENIPSERKNRQCQLRNRGAVNTHRSVPFISDSDSHSNTSRVSRRASRNKKHRAAKPYARTTRCNVAEYKDLSEIFGEPEGSILVLSGSKFDMKVASRLGCDDALDITVASNAAPKNTRDITAARNSTPDFTGQFHGASMLDLYPTRDITVASKLASDDTGYINVASRSASDHARDMSAASSATSDDTLLGDDYQSPKSRVNGVGLVSVSPIRPARGVDDWIEDDHKVQEQILFLN